MSRYLPNKMRFIIFVSFIFVEFTTGQEIVTVSGTQTVPPPDGDSGQRETVAVDISDNSRKMHYDVPDDGLLPNWCAIGGEACPEDDTKVIASFDLDTDTDCLHKCRELSCHGVTYNDGMCVLSSYDCPPDEREEEMGVYFRRLEEPKDGSPIPSCEDGTNPIGLDIIWPSNQYCKGVGVECPSNTMMAPRFRPTTRQCLVECNAHPSCLSAQYRDKMCYLREQRCTDSQLVPRPGGMDYYRLKQGEVCPDGRPLYVEEVLPYTTKFCVAWGKMCRGHDLYNKPQNVAPFQECLKKCARIKNCGSVDFAGNRCSPKDYRCSDDELENEPTFQNFMRLQEGEACPYNRKPPSQESPWSDRFCLKRDWACDLYNIADQPVTVPDFVECLRLCVVATSCEGAIHEGGMCWLKNKTCSPDERVQRTGANMYYRLREGDDCTEGTTPPECPLYSSFQTDYSSCAVTCDDQDPDACDMIEAPKCVCDSGYALLENGTCVPLVSCGCREHNGTHREIGESWISTDCAVESNCGLDDTDRPLITEVTRGCSPLERCDGNAVCLCLDGYYRAEDLAPCEPVLTCDEHSTYTPSSTSCPDTCVQQISSTATDCTVAPQPACLCNDGYILDQNGGVCVPYRDCGCLDDAGTHVQVETLWLTSTCDHVMMCTSNLDELPHVVVAQDYSCSANSHCELMDDGHHGWCVCDDGHIAHVNGTCQPVQPAIVCTNGTVLVEQTRTCASTCRQPSLATTCQPDNGPGCECAPGYLLDDEDECIPSEKCPCYDETGSEKMVGDSWLSSDCGANVMCGSAGAGAVPQMVSTPYGCPVHAVCDQSSAVPQCVCGQGYMSYGDLDCRPVLTCDEHSTYTPSGTGCPDTCVQPTSSTAADCTVAPQPACLCNDGYILDQNGGVCVPYRDCGCLDVSGNHYDVDSEWLSSTCDFVLTCSSNGANLPSIVTQSHTCPEHGHCQLDVTGQSGTCVCDEAYTASVDGLCQPGLECADGTIFAAQISSCPNTCRDPNSANTCEANGGPGCVCTAGQVLNDADQCILQEECPCYDDNGAVRKVGDSWLSSDCGASVMCASAGAGAVPQMVSTPYGCPVHAVCDQSSTVPQCVCEQGYVSSDNVCNPVLTCDEHSTYTPSSTSCPDTCVQPTSSTAADCTVAPQPACLCNDGYILDQNGGVCVPYRDCGCLDDAGTHVQVDSFWLTATCDYWMTCSSNGTELPRVVASENYTCSDHAHCQADSVSNYGVCVCDEGYIADTDGACQPAVHCDDYTVYAVHTRTCASTCRQPDLASTCQPDNGPGCECAPGYLLHDTDQCIPAETCPCYDENGGMKMAGDVWMSNDCEAYRNCSSQAPGLAPLVFSEPYQCQDNAVCDLTSAFPQCVCDEGFTPSSDDGNLCLPDEPPCEETLADKVNAFVQDIMTLLGGGCGSCSDTCRRPTASQFCSSASKICKCAQSNYLYDETLGKCIPANECGCYDDEGQQRLPGSRWLNAECSKQEACVSETDGPPQIEFELFHCLRCDDSGNCLDTK